MEKDYKQQHSRALSEVKSVVDSRCYALLFHRLGNSAMVEISLNYWLNGDLLQNQFFCISKNCTNFLLTFGSLANCSAFVADFDLKSELNGIAEQGNFGKWEKLS